MQWGKPFSSAETSEGSRDITAHFTDGSTVTGSHILGCDGSRSQVRKWLNPTAKNDVLPIRLLGLSPTYSAEVAQKLRDLDPYFFQGGDPATDTFLFFSFLDTPDNNTRQSADKDTYVCQVIISWPYRSGFLGSETPTEVPIEGSDRVNLLKKIAAGWTEPFKTIVAGVTESTEVKAISLEEWAPSAESWDNEQGRITLLGDAAHTMTMCKFSSVISPMNDY